ncbi:hypothetical protein [Bordetella bronchiseptica]
MRVELTLAELKVLGSVLSNHKYMLKAIMMDAELSQAVKDAEAAKHQRAGQILRKLRAAYKSQRPKRSVPAPVALPTEEESSNGSL